MIRRQKIIFLFALFLFGCLASYLLRPDYLGNILIVYSAPILLNLLWLRKTKIKLIVFSAVTAVLFAMPAELLGILSDSWDVKSSLPRLFGVIPPENILFAFFNFLWVLAFYEYFIDKEKKSRFGKKWRWLIGIYSVFFIFVMGSFFLEGENFRGVNYGIFGVTALLIPAVIIYIRNYKLLLKTILPTVFFALVFLIHEIVSMKMGHWWWPGEYFLPISVSGNIFPLEDVLIWYFLSTPALIGGYEFFADDYS